MSAGSTALSEKLEKALKESQERMIAEASATVADAPFDGQRKDPVRISSTVWYEIVPDESKKPVAWSLNAAIKFVNDFNLYIKTLAPVEMALRGEIIACGSTKHPLEVFLVWKGVRGTPRPADVIDWFAGCSLTKSNAKLHDEKSTLWVWDDPSRSGVAVELVGFPGYINL